jgi:hypothetical protein
VNKSIFAVRQVRNRYRREEKIDISAKKNRYRGEEKIDIAAKKNRLLRRRKN